MVPYAGTKRSSSQNDRGSHFDSRTVGGQVQGLSRRTEGRTEGRTRKDGTITQVVAQGNLHDQDIVALAQRVDQLELEKKDAKKPRESRTQHEIDRLEDKVDDLERRDCVREVLARVGWYGPPRRVYRE